MYYVPHANIQCQISHSSVTDKGMNTSRGRMLFSTNALNIGRLRFSGVLLGVGRQLVTDVSGQPIGPIFKGQTVQEQQR